VIQAFYEKQKVLISLPTGSGKSVIAADLAKDWVEGLHEQFNLPPRVLWLAHRDELINQAYKHIEDASGIQPAIEKGKSSVTKSAKLWETPIVVSSIQTMAQAKRRERFGPNEYGLVIPDEAHHVVAPSWLEVVNYFGSGNAKMMGMTATTDRADEVSLGKVFDVGAYVYDILQAMKDGYLAPLKQRFIRDVQLDFSNAKLSGGDYTDEALEQVISQEEVLHKIASATVKLAGNRQTLLFTPRVHSAEALAHILERYAGKGSALSVSGNTDLQVRREMLEHFQDGGFQFLTNSMLLTEGVDLPSVSCIVVARPTQSRALYAQMIGRGLRGGPKCPVPGKKNCLVIDLVGATRHKLMHTGDLLGGDYNEVVTEETYRWMDEQDEKEDVDADTMEALELAAMNEDELERKRRMAVLAVAKLKSRTIDPFVTLDVPERQVHGWDEAKPVSDAQRKFLEAQGLDLKAIDFARAKQLCAEIRRRKEAGECSFKQARRIRGFGYDPHLSKGIAGRVMADLIKRKFKHSKMEGRAFKLKRPITEQDLLKLHPEWAPQEALPEPGPADGWF
jgi:superfamily II DNA or RNA helicase